MREADNPDDIIPDSGPGKRKLAPTAKSANESSSSDPPDAPDSSAPPQKKKKKAKKTIAADGALQAFISLPTSH
jgi:hypothetical protein